MISASGNPPECLIWGGQYVAHSREQQLRNTPLVGKHMRRILDTLPLTPFALLDGARCVDDLEDLTIFYDLTPTRENPYPDQPALSRWDETAAVVLSVLGDQIDQDSIRSYIESAHPQDKRRMFLLDVIQKLQASTQRTASPLIETLASLSR